MEQINIEQSIEDFIKDIKNLRYKNNDPIASMIPYMLEGIAYALDINAEPQLRKRVAASIASYKNGISFEDMLSSMSDADYSDENSFNEYARIRELIIEASYGASRIIDKYFTDNFSEQKISRTLGLFMVAMQRLSTSFQATVLLLNSGFFVEVVPVLRQIYEQLCWACYLAQETDDADDTKLIKQQTQSCVKFLKTALSKDYGSLYGSLSKEAHLEPDSIGKYLQEESSNNVIKIKRRSGEGCNEATLQLILLLRIFGEVLHYGMENFGYPKTGNSYFNAWYGTHLTMCDNLHKAFKGECVL